MMTGSLRLGKLAGIDISIHVSWLVIVVLLTWSLATGWFATLYPGWSTLTYWLVSLLATLLLFASVLLHELAHSLVARARGLPVKNITLFIFGGISNIEQEPKSAGVEFQMSFNGCVESRRHRALPGDQARAWTGELKGEHAGSTRRNCASGSVHTPGASLTTTCMFVPCREESLLPPVHRCPCPLPHKGRLQ
jgi:hypothetical protein